MPPGPSTIETLDGRKILLCVGPGGVGKTTCAAAIALAAAATGKRVIVVTIDPSRRLAQALGLELTSTGDAASGAVVPVTAVGEGGGTLDALILHTRSVFDDLVRAYASSPDAASAILDNRIYQATAQRLGGALEYAAMARLQMLHARGEYDLVVLDTPPTVNAIDFLEAPARVREVVSNPVARILAGTGKLGMKILGLGAAVIKRTLNTIGGGDFVSDLGGFLRDFGDVLAEFHRRGGDLDQLLRSPQTGVVLATAAEEFTVREAHEFITVLRERGMRLDGVVLNRVEPPVPAWPERDQLVAALEGAWARESDAVLDAARRVFEGITIRAEAGRRARAELERRNPGVPVVVIERRVPPPAGLDELREIGEGIVGERKQ